MAAKKFVVKAPPGYNYALAEEDTSPDLPRLINDREGAEVTEAGKNALLEKFPHLLIEEA